MRELPEEEDEEWNGRGWEGEGTIMWADGMG